ncbi:carbohydrate porin [Legionella spiritensis]|uniref:Carbohydrate-selective porin, OprB family n=1 Tax=Legionella spiritensis TaxID=452 RepID=A0A0W0Z2J2_LEGSP|nr:carbohydrate porin [Legionella spiritensis]KTD63345.1 Carbohydrate-selective porin, OprB family [Legionella spiritensis]SNV35470.1 Carbohydrate-selective porin [Legionella spiritensis]
MIKGFAVVLVMIFALGTTVSRAEKPSTPESKISLFTISPELLYGLWRVHQFYGDPNMVRGPVTDRSFLLGNLGGIRDDLFDKGFIIDTNITQFLNSNLAGGVRHDIWRNDGSSDYLIAWDSGKAGVWSGGGILLHGESSWQAQRSINPDVGSVLPANYDATMPVPRHSETTLSEAYLVQALPENLIFLIGKINFAGLADQNVFANNENFQFDYAGLVNNPMLGAFVPYTPLGTGIIWVPNKQHTLAVIALDANGKASTTGFNTAFDGQYTYGVQYQYTTELWNVLPGNYRIIGGYTTKPPISFAIDQRQLLAELIGVIPIARKNNNYGILVNFDQYLWVMDNHHQAATKFAKGDDQPSRKGIPPLGFGLYGRAGWSPDDRNVISQFYSAGLGGYGLMFANRPDDNWGIGYAYTYFSNKLVRLLQPLRMANSEKGFEVFYNYALLPSTKITLNSQVIRSPFSVRKTAYTGGVRLRVML